MGLPELLSIPTLDAVVASPGDRADLERHYASLPETLSQIRDIYRGEGVPTAVGGLGLDGQPDDVVKIVVDVVSLDPDGTIPLQRVREPNPWPDSEHRAYFVRVPANKWTRLELTAAVKFAVYRGRAVIAEVRTVSGGYHLPNWSANAVDHSITVVGYRPAIGGGQWPDFKIIDTCGPVCDDKAPSDFTAKPNWVDADTLYELIEAEHDNDGLIAVNPSAPFGSGGCDGQDRMCPTSTSGG